MLFRVTVYPVGQNEAIEVLCASGLSCTPSMEGSVVEGDWDEVVATLGDVYRAIRAKHGRVYMKVDALDESGAAPGDVVPTTFERTASWLAGDGDASVDLGLG